MSRLKTVQVQWRSLKAGDKFVIIQILPCENMLCGSGLNAIENWLCGHVHISEKQVCNSINTSVNEKMKCDLQYAKIIKAAVYLYLFAQGIMYYTAFNTGSV